MHPTSAILHKTMSPTEARKRKARYSDIVATPESNKYSEESGMGMYCTLAVAEIL